MEAQTLSWDLVLSAIIGGVIALFLKVLGEIALDCYRDRHRNKLENEQKEMLRTMLDPKVMSKLPNSSGGVGVEWRTFETLQCVIGADENTTKRLLVSIGARGSTKDGSLWALRENKPLDPSELADSSKAFERKGG